MGNITKVIVALFLIFETVEDIRKKSVSLLWIVIAGILACGFTIATQNVEVKEILMGLAIGIAVMLLGYFTNCIGVGDGAVLTVIGVLIGGKLSLGVFLIGMTLAAFISLILLLFKRVALKQEIPFVPYMLVAYLGVILCV